MNKTQQFRPNSEHVRYRDGIWIPCRKRIFLYWFKFLRHAENDPAYVVDWAKYRPWGGKEEVMSSKFDDWWEERWRHCFGISERTGHAKFHVTKRHKADGVRYALLCYENRHLGSNWDIAVHIQKIESRNRHPNPLFNYAIEGLKTKTYMSTGRRRKRVRDESSRTGYAYVTEELHDHYDTEAFYNREQKRKIQGYVSRYLRQADSYLESVSNGIF